jgi:hypothetical protein
VKKRIAPLLAVWSSRKVCGTLTYFGSPQDHMSSQTTSDVLPGIVMDLRRSRRYRLFTRASFCWESLDGLLLEGKGITRDISTGGTFIVTDTVPESGAQLEIDVYLPSTRRSSTVLQLHGEGKVIRADWQHKRLVGFAAEVNLRADAASSPVLSSSKLQ